MCVRVCFEYVIGFECRLICFAGGTEKEPVTSNGVVHSSSTNQNASTKNNHRKSLDKGDRDKVSAEPDHKTINHKSFSHTNGDIHTEIQFIERVG